MKGRWRIGLRWRLASKWKSARFVYTNAVRIRDYKETVSGMGNHAHSSERPDGAFESVREGFNSSISACQPQTATTCPRPAITAATRRLDDSEPESLECEAQEHRTEDQKEEHHHSTSSAAIIKQAIGLGERPQGPQETFYS